jgi:site-specific DNA-methyltransferase (cytosine-N4-specific)
MKNFPDDFVNQIICGDSLRVLKKMPDECVDMIMTSPPYFGLRDYGVKKAIGLEPTYQEYLEKMLEITDELKRILKKEGSFYLNMGETYSSGLGDHGRRTIYDNITCKEATWVPDKNKPKRPKDIPTKCLMGIPWRLALSMIDFQGWILRNCIIWHKPNAMPCSVKDRLSNTYEFIFHFVKSKKYYYDLDAIRVPHKEASIKRVERAVSNKNKYFKSGDPKLVQGLNKPRPNKNKGIGKMQPGQFQGGDYLVGKLNPKGRNPGDVIKKEVEYRQKTIQDPNVKGLRQAPEPGESNALNPKGKNPGDVVKAKKWADENSQLVEFMRKKGSGGHYDYGGISSKKGKHYSLKGKNPGDVIKTEKYKQRKMYGRKEVGGQVRDNHDIHECYHPKGKNPGDILKSHSLRRKSWMSEPGHKFTHQKVWTDEEREKQGDFWEINTRPFKEAHFAVYPEEICERPMKAGCPQWICKKCGKARERIVKREVENPQSGEVDEKRLKGGVKKSGGKPTTSRPLTAIFAQALSTTRKTIGWTDCGCKAGFEPGIVLDPFAGACTTAIVAEKLRRNWIMIELNYEYCLLSRKRIFKWREKNRNLFNLIKVVHPRIIRI